RQEADRWVDLGHATGQCGSPTSRHLNIHQDDVGDHSQDRRYSLLHGTCFADVPEISNLPYEGASGNPRHHPIVNNEDSDMTRRTSSHVESATTKPDAIPLA